MSEYQSLQPPDMNTQERSVSQRLRYLTPLSVVVSLGANAIAMAATPSLADISDQNPTYMTPGRFSIRTHSSLTFRIKVYRSLLACPLQPSILSLICGLDITEAVRAKPSSCRPHGNIARYHIVQVGLCKFWNGSLGTIVDAPTICSLTDCSHCQLFLPCKCIPGINDASPSFNTSRQVILVHSHSNSPLHGHYNY